VIDFNVLPYVVAFAFISFTLFGVVFWILTDLDDRINNLIEEMGNAR